MESIEGMKDQDVLENLLFPVRPVAHLNWPLGDFFLFLLSLGFLSRSKRYTIATRI